MRIKETLSLSIENKENIINYIYRLTETKFRSGQAFGIEIERQDMKDGKVINIDRDSVDIISNNEEKVMPILDLLYKNNVSPIHLIDIIGQYVDECVEDFNSKEIVV